MTPAGAAPAPPQRSLAGSHCTALPASRIARTTTRTRLSTTMGQITIMARTTTDRRATDRRVTHRQAMARPMAKDRTATRVMVIPTRRR